MTITFAGQVALVTGAGSGLGRAYALELARRGARMAINELKQDDAETVAEEIRAAGGEALAFGADVSDFAQMEAMAARVIEAWGGVHVLINNAGTLRDRTFAKMDMADFERVVRVNLMGSAYATKAVWNAMREQNYGRVLMTTSSTGLGGNFGQANYGAAKMGLVGLARTLRLEGAKHDIRVNCLAPTAGTAMTADIFPDEVYHIFTPEAVVPAALFLVSKDAPTDAIVGAGGGLCQSLHITINDGTLLTGADLSVEGVAAAWPRIREHGHSHPFANGMEQASNTLKKLGLSQPS